MDKLPNDKKPKKKKRPSRLLRGLVAGVILIAFCFVLAFIALSLATDYFGIGDEDTVFVSIPQGSSISDIASILKENELISNKWLFILYNEVIADSEIQAGDYTLTDAMSFELLVNSMQVGNSTADIVRLTFYEGMSISEIADLLAENNVCSKTGFFEALNGDYNFDFLNMVPDDEFRYRKLEGYLFPDTYDFYVGENPESVVRKFLMNFQNRVFPEVYDQIVSAGMTLDEAITFASIVQEEAGKVEEMGKVSSVLHNRLDYPEMYPKLQCDVTIFYVENDIKPYQSQQTQDLYDAYNTYVCEGLPVGPICSPGLDAILATITPEDTPYYFFLTDKQGKYYYAADAQTHYANDRAAALVQ